MTPMDRHHAYTTWAPPLSPWSPWAKAAPFAHLAMEGTSVAEVTPADLAIVPPPAQRCAVVIDLPGRQSVETALALASRGYRPVPLFNACPTPTVSDGLFRPAVDVSSTMVALIAAVPMLARTPLGADAPPVFLLDAHRMGDGTPIGRGMFDNRSVVFASDFPSATFLRDHGIGRALVVHGPERPVGNDLRYALRDWRSGGLPLDVVTPMGATIQVRWPRHGFFGELATRVFAAFRLRRNSYGGFGGFVPEASAG